MERIFLTVGTNFDAYQLDKFIDLNSKYSDIKIKNLYGSLRTEQIGLASARPDFRLGRAKKKDFELFIKRSLDNDISIDYAANALLNMSVTELYKQKDKIVSHFKYLESIGVSRIISANPILMEIIANNTSLKIKASTILGVNKVSAIKHYKQLNVNCICPDIYINRNIPLLKAMQEECAKHSMTLEPLTNEICFFGDVPCNNVLRSNCYIHSSIGGNEQKHFNNWPFSRCQEVRKNHPSHILKIPFILPSHLDYYAEKTGIRNFKVSGRTNTFEYLESTVEAYMKKEFKSNIEQLFMLPQNMGTTMQKKINFDKLTKIGFFEKILSAERGCDYNCHLCNYCDMIYDKI